MIAKSLPVSYLRRCSAGHRVALQRAGLETSGQELAMYEETVNRTAVPKGPLAVVLAGVIAVGGLFGYSLHERGIATRLSAQNQELAASLKDTRGEIDSVTAKMNSLVEAQQQAAQQMEQARQRATRAAVQGRRGADTRLKKLQSALDEQARAIDATRQDLASTGTELRGSIARTHDELV